MRLVPGAIPEKTEAARAQIRAHTSRYNPPAQRELTYRAGTYSSLLERLLEHVHTLYVPGTSEGSGYPLRNLNINAPYDVAVSLIKAWAAVGDVLTFYQQRIYNEGYIRTATEDQSVRELVRCIGYEPRPGLAAQTYLAFTVLKARGAPIRVIVPKGTAVQSIPAQGESPVTFETISEIEARLEWSDIKLYNPSSLVVPLLDSDATAVRLSGTRTTLKPGSPILITGEVNTEGTENGRVAAFRLLTGLEPNTDQGFVLARWGQPLGSDSKGPFAPSVFTFKRKAGLFGHSAPQWSDISDDARDKLATRKGGVFRSLDSGRHWRPVGPGLPYRTVRALEIGGSGWTFAGTAEGVYRSDDGGQSWRAVNTGLTKKDIQCLLLDGNEHLYAGTSGGGVFRSTDGGESWESIRGGVKLQQSGRKWQPTNARLPDTVVRALSAHIDVLESKTYLFAGTDTGIFRSEDYGSSWEPANDGMPGEDSDSGIASVVINSIIFSESLGHVFAGTDAGVFRSRDMGVSWEPASQGLPHYRRQSQSLIDRLENLIPGHHDDNIATASAVNVLLACQDGQNTLLLAGTNSGVFASKDEGDSWSPMDQGFPYEPEASEYPELRVRALAACSPSDEGVCVFAGTDKGVFRCKDGERWEPVNSELLFLFGISADAAQDLDAQKLPDDFAREAANSGITLGSGTTVSVVTQGSRWLVTDADNNQTYAVEKNGDVLDVFRQVSLTNLDIRALAAGLSCELIMATPPSGYLETEWPRFRLQDQNIDLDRAYPTIREGSWVVLSQERPIPLVAAYKVEDAYTVSRQDFSRNSNVTRLVVQDQGSMLQRFDLREATVFAESQELEVFQERQQIYAPLQGDRVLLDGQVHGLRVGQPLSVSGKRQCVRLFGNLGGVFEYSGDTWKSIGLPQKDIQALVTDASGNVYAADKYCVYQRQDNDWELLGELKNGILCLAIGPGGGLYAGTSQGVSVYSGDDWEELPGLSDQVDSLVVDSSGEVYAGTPSGILRLQDDQWESKGPAQGSVAALVVDSRNRIYAATRGGVVALENDGLQSLGLEADDVLSLAIGAGDVLYAGTASGVFRLGQDGAWKAVGLLKKRAEVLVAGPDDCVYAGTNGDGIYRYSPVKSRWEPVPIGAANVIRALAIDTQQRVITGTADAAILTSMDGIQHKTVSQSVALSLANTFVSELDQAVITSDLADAFEKGGVELSGYAQVEVRSKGSAWLIRDQANTYLVRNYGDKLQVQQSELLEVTAPPADIENGSQLSVWRLQDSSGFEGCISARDDEVVWELDPSESPDVSEVAFVSAVEISSEDETTSVSLEAPLQNVYNPSAVSVCANVAYATHGESVKDEILGSGDANKANQQFVLKKPPLTYILDPDSAGVRDTLSVRVTSRLPRGYVQGLGELAPSEDDSYEVLWEEVPSLYSSGPTSHHYMVRTDDDGKTSVIFGDGHQGARLPSGQGHVIATYRSGLGEEGNLETGRLTMLKQRPPGITKVTNPVPATGGAPSEDKDKAREEAPLTVRTLGRVVSLDDYEDMVRAYPGIGKAQGRLIWNGHSHVVHITVAGSDGSAIGKDTPLHRNLIKSIDSVRASHQAVSIDSYEPLFFDISARVMVRPDLKPSEVEKEVSLSLSQTFAFDVRQFGQDVSGSEVIAVIQRVPGVLAVELQYLNLHGHARRSAEVLESRSARWDSRLKQILPAQLLLINTDTGIRLEMEKGI